MFTQGLHDVWCEAVLHNVLSRSDVYNRLSGPVFSRPVSPDVLEVISASLETCWGGGTILVSSISRRLIFCRPRVKVKVSAVPLKRESSAEPFLVIYRLETKQTLKVVL